MLSLGVCEAPVQRALRNVEGAPSGRATCGGELYVRGEEVVCFDCGMVAENHPYVRSVPPPHEQTLTPTPRMLDYPRSDRELIVLLQEHIDVIYRRLLALSGRVASLEKPEGDHGKQRQSNAVVRAGA